jgi:hypothetical protein
MPDSKTRDLSVDPENAVQMEGERMSVVEHAPRAEPTKGAPSVAESTGGGFTDAELTALALAADPDAPLDEDAVPMSMYLAHLQIALPDWYMPSAMVQGCKRWRIPIILLIVSAFLIIEGLGLCNTFGQLTLP